MHAALTRVLPSARARAHDRSRSRYAIIIIAANNGPVIGALHAFLVLLFGSFASFGQVTPFASAFSPSFSFLPSLPPSSLSQLQSSSRVCTRLQQQSAISNSRGLQKEIRREREKGRRSRRGRRMRRKRRRRRRSTRVRRGSRKSQKWMVSNSRGRGRACATFLDHRRCSSPSFRLFSRFPPGRLAKNITLDGKARSFDELRGTARKPVTRCANDRSIWLPVPCAYSKSDASLFRKDNEISSRRKWHDWHDRHEDRPYMCILRCGALESFYWDSPTKISRVVFNQMILHVGFHFRFKSDFLIQTFFMIITNK